MTASTPADAHLGIDLGTSSVKAVLLSPRGTQIAQAEAPYAVTHLRPGWAESAPMDWWNATASAVRGAVARAPRVLLASIGLSGQMHGVVPTRSDGSPVRDGILWADSRA
jgi:xylulokinase